MKLKELIDKQFDLLETVFLLLFALGFGLILLQKNYANYVLGAGAGSLAILYWIKAVVRYENEDNKSRYSRKFVWYILMFSPIAIYFKINLYPKADYFLLFVSILLVIALAMRLLQRLNKTLDFKNEDFVRLSIALIISIFVYSLPFATL